MIRRRLTTKAPPARRGLEPYTAKLNGLKKGPVGTVLRLDAALAPPVPVLGFLLFGKEQFQLSDDFGCRGVEALLDLRANLRCGFR